MPQTARETVETLFRTITEGTRDDLADLYAPDVRIVNPFAPDGVPSEAQGNEALRTRMKAFENLWTYDAVDVLAVHETVDPEVVVAEFRVSGTTTAEGTKFALDFVNVMRIRDGLIAESRDYSNPTQTAVIAEELKRAGA